MTRSKVIQIRVSEDEHAAIKSRAAFFDKSMSDWLRDVGTAEAAKPAMKVTSSPVGQGFYHQPVQDRPMQFQCKSCGTISRVPRCVKDSTHDVSPI